MGIIPNIDDDLELDESGQARHRARPRPSESCKGKNDRAWKGAFILAPHYLIHGSI